VATDYKVGIKINADGKLATRELNNVGKSAEKTQGRVKGLAKEFSLYKKALVVGAAVAFTHELDKQAEAMDRIGKTADKVGLTTDELQEMRFAGEQTGVSVNNLDLSMQRFSRRLGEAAKGKGELVGTLDDYNISAVDAEGNTRRNVDVLGDLADAIKNANSDQERLRIAFKAFDSEGAALVNTLKNGKEGLDAGREAAHRYNQVVSSDSIRSAERYNDAMGKLTGSFTKFRQDAITPLLPALTEFFDLLNGDVGTRELDEAAENIKRKIADIDAELGRFRFLRINPFASSRDLEQDKQALLDELDIIERRITTFNFSKLPDNKTPGPVIVDGPSKETTKALSSLTALDAQLKQQAATLGLSSAAVLKYRLEVGDLSDELALAGDKGESIKASLLSRAAALDSLTKAQQANKDAEAARQALEAQGAELTKSLLTPLEVLAATEGRLNKLRRSGVISQETLSRAVAQANKVYQESNVQLTEALAIYEATLTPQERFVKQVEKLNALLDAGAFDNAGGMETYRRGVEQAKESLLELNDESSRFAQEAASNIQDSFAEFLFDPFADGIDGMARGLADTLRRMAAESLAAQANVALLGSGFDKTGQVGGLLGDLGRSIGVPGVAPAEGADNAGMQGVIDAVVNTGASSTEKTILQSAADAVIGSTATNVGALTVQAAIAAQTTALIASSAANTSAIVAAVGAGAASSGASSALSIGTSSTFGNAFSSFLPTFHTGGISPREQLAVLLKDEEVLTTGDSRHSNNNNLQSSNTTLNFTINATDGPSVLRSRGQIERELVTSLGRAKRNA
jgi:hypothetical protein